MTNRQLARYYAGDGFVKFNGKLFKCGEVCPHRRYIDTLNYNLGADSFFITTAAELLTGKFNGLPVEYVEEQEQLCLTDL